MARSDGAMRGLDDGGDDVRRRYRDGVSARVRFGPWSDVLHIAPSAWRVAPGGDDFSLLAGEEPSLR